MIIIAITGASGTVVGTRLAEELKKHREVRIIVSDAAKKTAEYELGAIPTHDFEESQLDAPIASSSTEVEAMVICPCSVKTLAAIAHGYANNLITRSADNCLKMRRKLILCVRETPYSLIHIDNMKKVTEAGGIILPLNAAYYNQPRTIDDVTDFFVGKILDTLGIKNQLYKRWKNDVQTAYQELK